MLEKNYMGLKIFALFSLLIIIVSVSLCINNQQPINSQLPTDNDATENIELPENNEPPETINIQINNYAFNPAELEINQGDTVIWTNMDSVKHTVTSDSGDELDSSLLSSDETYSHTFNEAGEFAYHCTPHPMMKGKIIVT